MVQGVKLSERDIQSQVTDWLTLKGIFWYRQNTGAMTRDYKGRRRFIRFGARGAPDIVCCIRGKYVAIELKRPGGRQTSEQAAFEANLKLAGGIYILGHSLEDVVRALDNLSPKGA